MKILVTGGPVHAKLDAVKFVTNRFKGGLMAKLADEIIEQGVHVTYLCSKGSKRPQGMGHDDEAGNLEVVYHDGFHDYRAKVKEMAPEFDAVVLGAAVANLIPVAYWGKPVSDGESHKHPKHSLPLEGKFPSHNYEPGDSIEMEWQIAPRIIDEAKAVMKKGAHLFGFKLLGGVEHEAAVRQNVVSPEGQCHMKLEYRDNGKESQTVQRGKMVGQQTQSENSFEQARFCRRIAHLMCKCTQD